jgi:hypothetical protein
MDDMMITLDLGVVKIIFRLKAPSPEGRVMMSLSGF